MNAHKVPSRSMAIENLMNSQKTALLRPRVLQEALKIVYITHATTTRKTHNL